MRIVIQCAATKSQGATHLHTSDGRRVMFVARPDLAPRDDGRLYARPDDLSDDPSRSWREQLERHNAQPARSPWNLLPAFRLYAHPIYQRLVAQLGATNVFILSAGWGLVRADYLLPMYDITFSGAQGVARYKRRHVADQYADFCHLHTDRLDPVVFFGGRAYLPLFAQLTDPMTLPTFVFFNSSSPPRHSVWRTLRFATKTRTNWHYECADAFLDGRISTA